MSRLVAILTLALAPFLPPLTRCDCESFIMLVALLVASRRLLCVPVLHLLYLLTDVTDKSVDRDRFSGIMDARARQQLGCETSKFLRNSTENGVLVIFVHNDNACSC
jgi:hypothetical protein